MTDEDVQTKAIAIATVAKENGWKGAIRYDEITHETTLSARRGCESVLLIWDRNRLIQKPEYKLLGRTYYLPSQGALIQKLNSKPDIIKLLKINAGKRNPVELVKQYRDLPFDVETDNDETIIAALVNRRIWWYNSVSMGVQNARVMMPKRKSQVFNIKSVNHRRMFNFTEPDIGMRSVMLDQLLKVQ